MKLKRGETFQMTIYWSDASYTFATVTGITRAAPCVVTTSAAHGLPGPWRVALESVRGMDEINELCQEDPSTGGRVPRLWATPLTSTTFKLDSVNSLDFSAYTSGGAVRYRTPVDLTGYTARMQIKDKVGGTVLLNSATGDIVLAVDTTAKTTAITIPASVTAAITWSRGVTDLEMVNGTYVKKLLVLEPVEVEGEVTT